jgi:hypothetical protein
VLPANSLIVNEVSLNFTAKIAVIVSYQLQGQAYAASWLAKGFGPYYHSPADLEANR